MKTDFMKTRVVYVARTLLILTAVLVCVMVAKVNAFVSNADSIPKRIEKAISQGSEDGGNLKELKAPYTEAANSLKKKNLFTPPTPEKKNPVSIIDAVLGNEALIKGKFYKAGDKIGDAQIISVSAKSVMIRWNDKEIAIHPFTHTAKLDKKKSKPKTTKKSSEAKQVVVKDKPKKPKPPKGQSPLSEEEARRLIAERRGSGRPDGRGRGMGSRGSRDGGRGGRRGSRSR
jgi:hypothetical protein